MFVKIHYWDVKKEVNGDTTIIIDRKLNCEHLYECGHITWTETNREVDGKKVSEVDLGMELHKPGPREVVFRNITFLRDAPDLSTEIFVMNDQGKTIDRRCY